MLRSSEDASFGPRLSSTVKSSAKRRSGRRAPGGPGDDPTPEPARGRIGTQLESRRHPWVLLRPRGIAAWSVRSRLQVTQFA